MKLDSDDVAVFLDSWGIRRLFSLAVRRRGSSRKKRDPFVEDFFGILEANWGSYKPKGKNNGDDKVHDMPEEENVDPALLSDTEVSESCDVHLRRALSDAYTLVASPQKDCPAGIGDSLAESKGDAGSTEKALEDLDGLELDLEEALLLQQLEMLRPSQHVLL